MIESESYHTGDQDEPGDGPWPGSGGPPAVGPSEAWKEGGGAPPPERMPRFPGFKGSVLLLGFLFLMNFLVSLAIFGVSAVAGGTAVSPPLFAAAYVISFGGTLWLGVSMSRSSFREVLRITSFPRSVLVPVVAVLFGLWVMIIEMTALVTRAIPVDESMMKEMEEMFFKSLWVGIPLLVVAAPIMEETLFRGIILRGLLARYTPARAVTLNAVFFAAAHFNIWQLPASFGAGLFLGWVYLRTRSLGLCIMLHAFHNLMLAFVGQYVADLLGVSTEGATMPFVPWWVVVVGAAFIAFGVYGAEKRVKAQSRALMG